MELMIYIHFWVLFLRMVALNTQQHLKEDLLILPHSFTFFISSFFLVFLSKLSCTERGHVCNLYRIFYTLSFCNLMFYIVSEICIGRRFSEDCFCCYSQQLISTNQSLIPYNILKRAPETHNL